MVWHLKDDNANSYFQLKKIQKKADGTTEPTTEKIKKTSQGKVTKKKRSKCKHIMTFPLNAFRKNFEHQNYSLRYF